MTLFARGARVVDAATGATLTRAGLPARAYPDGAVFALMATTIPAVAHYLSAFEAGRPVALLDPAGAVTDLVARFEPALVTGVTGGAPKGYRKDGDVWVRKTAAAPVHPDLGVLLTTSGSTGDPKMVRLSRAAVLANAASIAQSLDITAAEVAPTTLPLFYSYGMSVLNSHLRSGATVVLERTGLMQADFWTAATTYGFTSLAAVPYQYEMLRRLRFDPAKYPALRTLTQAGGRLRTELVEDFALRMAAVDGRFIVMYGQTEAGPRMAALPADRLAAKLGSAGKAIPGGAFVIDDDEVVYRGPNVMMGYGETAADLALGDEMHGELRTGDLGRLDDEGFLFLTGRIKRMGKVFGVRVNLDDVERHLTGHGPVAAVPAGDKIRVYAEGADEERCRVIRKDLTAWLDTHFTGLDVRPIEALPLLPTGKIDYRTLEASS